MSRRPKDQLDVGRAFYARSLPDVDSAHFGALWHLFTVGHLVATDLDGIAREIGCSFADLDLLGTLAVDDTGEMRATDLASTLYVSNAVISIRVARLCERGLVLREGDPRDGRAFVLRLTEQGRAMVEEAVRRITREAKIVRFFRQMGEEDRTTLVRLLGDLHQRYDREFIGSRREDV